MVNIVPTILFGLCGLVSAQTTHVVNITNSSFIQSGNFNSNPADSWELDLNPVLPRQTWYRSFQVWVVMARHILVLLPTLWWTVSARLNLTARLNLVLPRTQRGTHNYQQALRMSPRTAPPRPISYHTSLPWDLTARHTPVLLPTL
ncbi:hypothetical protein RNJ44_00110 [Nakaseomyces bracarensis]|uniref:Uncharacterized protein n=1 Tax=Nakaseomyces bracarensis TaxID=273131 RepID=A0ABR4P184_9SACH